MNSYKIIGIITLLSLSISATSLSHEEIIKMVLKIKEERIGIDLATLEKTPNPFPIVEEVKEKKVEKKIKIERPKIVKKTVIHKLVAILNHSAFIDGKWYKVGNKVGVYTLTHIGIDSVTIKSEKESKRLVIPQREKKFKMFRGN
ncbi:hypothetical protein MNB_SV-12-553 [hydrothermal vent metagenome]|uniref:Uncharacterized protein n=1 Tax=hydrothermal vent metagenome TaxID=652676 RepID=A0A1W1CP05_9ZZZZ